MLTARIPLLIDSSLGRAEKWPGIDRERMTPGLMKFVARHFATRSGVGQ